MPKGFCELERVCTGRAEWEKMMVMSTKPVHARAPTLIWKGHAMGRRSYVLRNTDKIASDAKREGENPNTHHVDQAATSDRRQEIVVALKAHLETVYRSHGKAADTADFDPHLDLFDAGYLDSLSASEFLLLAEEQYAIALPDWLIGGRANSLAALALYIEAELARGKS
jgi:acyl carrier protein